MMPCIAIIVFNINGMCFTDNMTLLGQHFSKRRPVISIKNALF
jgi:hypothetical protein